MKSAFKKIGLGILILFGLYALYVIILGSFYEYRGYTLRKNEAKFIELVEKPFREDTYGGKTPEETWALFLDALKKGDVELAVKYCSVERQRSCRDSLVEAKEKKELSDWITNFGKIRKSKNQPMDVEEINYSFDVFSKEYKQVLTERVIFRINTYTKIWKIEHF